MNASGYLSSAWPTARVSAARGLGNSDRGLDGSNCRLEDTAAAWPTPAVADTTGSRKARSGSRSDELLINGQSEAIMADLTPLPVPATETDGARSSSAGPTSPRRLNPMFVEWLMGWPEGWTLLALPPSTESEPTLSGCSETAFTLWRQHMHCALSRLASQPEAAPVQMSLFG